MNQGEQNGKQDSALHLEELQDGEAGVILSNNDRKSTEMGLYQGASVIMFRNRKAERSLVIGAGEARFLISRRIAHNVMVQRNKSD